jgi:pimeloyl-ACP methyl ester carboxylesterase
MPIEYVSYSRQAIQSEVSSLWIDQWRLDYLAFSTPENANKPPLLVVGGAFQNFNSYKYCVERIYEDFPVVLVDLPSLGNNDQIAPDLGMEDLADLLYELVREAGWQQVHLMGLSLGSAIASTFAYKYPEQTGKLIVAGIVVRPRKSWRMLVEESVRVLEEERMDEFSQAVVLYLVNYLHLKDTGMTPTARKLFYRQMKRLNENERERYKINGRRLLSVEGLLGYPECETLVTTGEYDSFTLPWENASFARECPNGRFVLIRDADHLPQLEQREVSLELFSSFLNGQPLEQVKGIRLVPKDAIARMDRRRSERLVPASSQARLVADSPVDERYRLNREVEIVDISFFGCLLKVNGPSVPVAEHARDCSLLLSKPDIQLELLIFDYDDHGHLRCLFKHGNISRAEEFVQKLKDPQLFLAPAVGKVHKLHG